MLGALGVAEESVIVDNDDPSKAKSGVATRTWPLTGFVLFTRGVFVFLYFAIMYIIPATRAMLSRYVIGFMVSMALVIGGAAADDSLIFGILWGVGLLFETLIYPIALRM